MNGRETGIRTLGTFNSTHTWKVFAENLTARTLLLSKGDYAIEGVRLQ